jgi:hypothetical protein
LSIASLASPSSAGSTCAGAAAISRRWRASSTSTCGRRLRERPRVLEASPPSRRGSRTRGCASPTEGTEAADKAMQSAAALERGRLERWLAFLATVGNNAPFVGLFGTVVGVIHAFEELGTHAPGTRRHRRRPGGLAGGDGQHRRGAGRDGRRHPGRAAGGGGLQLPAAAGGVVAVGRRRAHEPGARLHRRWTRAGRAGAALREVPVAASSGRPANGIISGINVTPLVDVMLVLLVIFIVTAKIIVTPAVPLDLPHARTARRCRSCCRSSSRCAARCWSNGAL